MPRLPEEPSREISIVVHGFKRRKISFEIAIQSISQKIYSVEKVSRTKKGWSLSLPELFRVDTIDLKLHIGEDDDNQDGCIISIPTRLTKKERFRGWAELETVSTLRMDPRAWLLLSDIQDPSINEETIIISLTPPASDFMGHIPDDTLWQDLSLAGTHDSCAFYGYPISQCQQPSTSIFQQLCDGIRFLDLRMRVINGELIMYHGIRNQRATFNSVLEQIISFLAAHPSESLLISLKEEVPPIHPTFSSLVYSALEPYFGTHFFLESRLPTIGEIRGKAMIMPRFPLSGEWTGKEGLKPDTWPDNLKGGFELDIGNEKVRVQDWYVVKMFIQIPEKLEAVINHLRPCIFPNTFSTQISDEKSFNSSDASDPKPLAQNHPLSISYLSAASWPMSPPMVLAKGFGWPEYGFGVEGLNSRLTRWLLERLAKGEEVRATVPCDFYREIGDVAGLMIALNFIDDDHVDEDLLQEKVETM